MKIIPAIDLIDGKCVRLTQGDYDSVKVYNENPLEIAKQFEDAGLTRVHVVDLDGAKALLTATARAAAWRAVSDCLRGLVDQRLELFVEI